MNHVLFCILTKVMMFVYSSVSGTVNFVNSTLGNVFISRTIYVLVFSYLSFELQYTPIRLNALKL